MKARGERIQAGVGIHDRGQAGTCPLLTSRMAGLTIRRPIGRLVGSRRRLHRDGTVGWRGKRRHFLGDDYFRWRHASAELWRRERRHDLVGEELGIERRRARPPFGSASTRFIVDGHRGDEQRGLPLCRDAITLARAEPSPNGTYP